MTLKAIFEYIELHIGKAAHPNYKTLKDARADGWHERKVDEIGGEEITIKGHTLVRNTTM